MLAYLQNEIYDGTLDCLDLWQSDNCLQLAAAKNAVVALELLRADEHSINPILLDNWMSGSIGGRLDRASGQC
jgi:hypothetical protein